MDEDILWVKHFRNRLNNILNYKLENIMQVLITYNNSLKDKVVIHNQDFWEGDVTLAKVIYPFLKKYRKLYDKKNSVIGYPMAFAPNPSEPEGPDNPDRFDEWLQCLDQMIYSFEWIAKHRDWCGPEEKEFHKACCKLLKPYKKELKKLAQEDEQRSNEIEEQFYAFSSLEWNRRSEILRPAFEVFNKKSEEHRKKIQDGIDLFAKHFSSL